ncbi:MAG: TauD/TfdA family dioxygenase [Gammaproteobacteria bacterium]|nr:TauD/TfdA family dioxygenase [Gammaproteobacteria bacterium]
MTSGVAKSRSASVGCGEGGPFDLGDDTAYRAWRARKLSVYPIRGEELVVDVADGHLLSAREQSALIERCRKMNMAIYRLRGAATADKDLIRALGRQLGLCRLDGNLCADHDSVSAIRAMPIDGHQEYIPYTNRRLNWHTDGYYNLPGAQIRAVLMHCVSDAASGGENALMDHEMVYLLMRDENPDYVAALMEPDAMTIPANVENGTELRAAQTGPVFSVDARTGNLHMRYTARTRSILWKNDAGTRAAADFLQNLFYDGSPYVIRHRLNPGEGIVCNNVLHCRTAFMDGAARDRRRLLYRARYYDRISGTDLGDFLSGGP